MDNGACQKMNETLGVGSSDLGAALLNNSPHKRTVRLVTTMRGSRGEIKEHGNCCSRMFSVLRLPTNWIPRTMGRKMSGQEDQQEKGSKGRHSESGKVRLPSLTSTHAARGNYCERQVRPTVVFERCMHEASTTMNFRRHQIHYTHPGLTAVMYISTTNCVYRKDYTPV
jgi:hypothetical protein